MKCATYKASKNIMPYLIKITLVFKKEYLAKLRISCRNLFQFMQNKIIYEIFIVKGSYIIAMNISAGGSK